jgi:hypothetical protein
MNIILGGLEAKGIITVMSLIIITALFLSSCGSIQGTEIIDAQPVEIAVSTTTPTQVEPIIDETMRKEEIVNNINDYLNGEGEYSVESFLSRSSYFFGPDYLMKGELPLGMITSHLGQFILVDSYYNSKSKTIYLYLGAVDKNGERVVLEYNFARTFFSGSVGDPTGLTEKNTPILDLVGRSTGSDKFKPIFSSDEWNIFLEENEGMPIVLMWDTTSVYEKTIADGGQLHQPIMVEYDLGMDLRIAIYNRLQKLGRALSYNPSKTLSDKETQIFTVCLWGNDNFKGLDSLDDQCPSGHGIINLYVRRP